MRMEIKEIIIFYCETEKHNQGQDVLTYTTKNLEYAKTQFNKCKNCYLVKLRIEYDDEEIYEEILIEKKCFFLIRIFDFIH